MPVLFSAREFRGDDTVRRAFVFLAGKRTVSGADPHTARMVARAARALGLRPVLVGPDATRYPQTDSDGWEARLVSDGSAAGAVDACRTLGPGALAGVLGDGEETAATAARVASALNLPSPPPTAVDACLDRKVQRLLLAGHRLAPRAQDNSWDRTAPTYLIQALDGDLVGLAQPVAAQGKTGSVAGYDAPGPVTRRTAENLRRQVRSVLAALTLTRGAAQVRVRRSTEGFPLVEVRVGQFDALTGYLNHLATGFDVVTGIVASAAGRTNRPVRARRRHACVRFVDAVPADVTTALAAVRSVPGVVALRLGSPKDDPRPAAAPPSAAPAGGRAVGAGWVVAVGERHEVAVHAVERAAALAAGRAAPVAAGSTRGAR